MREWKWHGVLATHEAPPAPPLPLSSLSARIGKMWVGKVLIKQCGVMYFYCVCWTAQSRGGALSPTGRLSGPFRRHPVTVLAIVIALWVWCELMSRARVTLAFMRDIVQSLGAAIIARSPIPRSISRYRVIDMNPDIANADLCCNPQTSLNVDKIPSCMLLNSLTLPHHMKIKITGSK